MVNWYFRSATQLADAIRSKQIKAVELVEIYKERYHRINPELNAIITDDFENALNKAADADKALAEGTIWGPLHGVPITIKDNLEVTGMTCTAGSSDFKNHIPARNADVVESLSNAGAIVLGKTNLPRFAEDLQTYNDLYGQTNNPFDVTKTPGGSSGGSATALAAGLSSLEIGNDIGGSIRTPAHFCGIFGHKPSYGIVPLRGLVPPAPGIFTGDYFFNMDIVVNGPLARSAEDLELAMDLIVQPDACDRKAVSINLPSASQSSLSEFKIGFWMDDPECPVDKSIVSRLEALAESLGNAGAQVVHERPDVLFPRGFDLFSFLLNSVLGQAAPARVYKKWIEMEPELEDSVSGYQYKQIKGAIQRHRDWLMRDAERQIMRQKWAEYFERVDLLICPVAPVAAFPHDHGSWFKRTLSVNGEQLPYANIMGWAGLTNAVYLPATVAPVGFTPEGLPIGIQIVAPYLEDKRSIRFAALLEKHLGGFVPPPGFA